MIYWLITFKMINEFLHDQLLVNSQELLKMLI